MIDLSPQRTVRAYRLAWDRQRNGDRRDRRDYSSDCAGLLPHL